MVQLDLHNAYARLGVSPLMSTEEIKEVINRKRKDVMRRRRTRGEQQFGEEEAEMTLLQAIEDEIGMPKARARYDRLNPQNALLTIQPSPCDARLDPKSRAGLATAWLIEELGRTAALPSPESLSLWATRGLDPELIAFLSSFALGDVRRERETERGDASTLTLDELDRGGLLDRARNGPEPTPKTAETSPHDHAAEDSTDG
jgi:hypothetical protein